LVGVETGSWVVAAESCLASAGGADCSWAESCSWAVGDGGVEGGAEDGDVVFLLGVLETTGVRQVGKSRNATEAPLC
jgi:hypothetical protein